MSITRRLARIIALALFAMLIAGSSSLLASEISFLLNPKSDPIELRALLPAPEPDQELRFSVSSRGLREAAWLSLAEQISDTRFRVGPNGSDTLSFLVQPDPYFIDRVYPSFFAGPQVGIVNLDYWILEAASRRQVLSASFPAFFLGKGCATTGQVSLDRGTGNQVERRGRYVAVGTDQSACQVIDGLTVIDTGSTPQWIRELAVKDFNRFRKAFAEHFDVRLPAPMLYLHADSQPGQRSRYRGDSGWQQTIFLRFFGDAWDTFNTSAARTISKFVVHETAHLWLGSTFHQAAGSKHPWFHEGAAEYLSLDLLGNNPDPYEAGSLREANGRLTSCLQTLDGNSLNLARRSRGSAPYDCGYVLHWLVDIHDRVFREESVWARWRGYLATRPNRQISWQGFLNWGQHSERLDALVAPLFEPMSFDSRLGKLRTRLADLNLRIDASPKASSRVVRRTVLFHLLGEVCTSGDIGFQIHEQSLELDTGSRCGSLSDDPHVRTLDGYDLLDAAESLHAHVGKVCLEGGELTFAGLGDTAIPPISCNAPLPALPLSVEVQQIDTSGL